MRSFWPSFFGFLIVVAVIIGQFRPDLADGALLFLGAWLVMVAYIILAVLVVGGLAVLWLVLQKQRLNANRPVDGAYPLQQYRLRNGKKLIVNPNNLIGASAIVDPANGLIEVEPAAGWAAAAGLRAAIERTNAVRAMYPGDHARMDRNGAMSAMPRMTNGTAKMLDAPRQPQLSAPVESPRQPQLPAPVAVNPVSAIRTLGMGSTADGEIVQWNPANHPHLRIHGASQGSGKTNLMKILLLGMVTQGAHVVILDRRRFKDFSEFRNRAELVDTSNPQTFVSAATQLAALYRERDQLLGQHGASNIAELPQRLLRYVVAITEFGSLCAVASAEGCLTELLQPLTLILREAGAAGIHIIIEDQIVERGKWPRGISANATPITGRLPLNLGAAGGYHHAHSLRPYQFHYDGVIFNAFDARGVTGKMLAVAPPYDPGLEIVHANVHTDSTHSYTSTNVHERGYERAGADWGDVVAAWFSANPAALTGPARGITSLARAMAEHRGVPDEFENFKSAAHIEYHKFRSSVRLTSGDRLGVDSSINILNS